MNSKKYSGNYGNYGKKYFNRYAKKYWNGGRLDNDAEAVENFETFDRESEDTLQDEEDKPNELVPGTDFLQEGEGYHYGKRFPIWIVIYFRSRSTLFLWQRKMVQDNPQI